MRSIAVLAVLAAPLASAIQFTSPAGPGTTLTKGSSFGLTWTSVITDPAKFDIVLWNYANYPPQARTLVSNVDTSVGSYTVVVPCDVSSLQGYQFNAMTGGTIFAQTQQFAISGACSP